MFSNFDLQSYSYILVYCGFAYSHGKLLVGGVLIFLVPYGKGAGATCKEELGISRYILQFIGQAKI